MISCFPTPYPDELWYSVVCRYHIRSGNLTIPQTLQEVYAGHHLNIPIELCGNLRNNDFFSRTGFEAKEIIMQHTLLPYFTRFFSTDRKKSSYYLALNGNRHAGQHIGIYQSTRSERRIMRYCPQCFAEDIQQYGEPYWHRLHQLPDIHICLKHHCWLADTDVDYSGMRHSLIYPATPDMFISESSKRPVPDCLYRLDNLVAQALTAPFAFTDGRTYQAVISQALYQRGWRSLTGKRVYAEKIAAAMREYYQGYPDIESVDSTTIHGIISGRGVSVIRILRLACFLGLSLDSLLSPAPPEPDYICEMQALYQRGMSMYSIAQLYGTDAKTVARWVR